MTYERNLRIGVDGYTNDELVLSVYGDTSLEENVSIGKNVNISGIITSPVFSTGQVGSAININVDTITGPSTIIIDPSSIGDSGGSVRVKGDFYVDGIEYSLNFANIDAFTIGIATQISSNIILDGAGIGIGSDNIKKTLLYEYDSDSLKSSENFDLSFGKSYKINGVDVLNSTELIIQDINSSGIASLTDIDARQLLVSGISTLGTLQVSPGIVTATSGIITYYGDGSKLQGVVSSTAQYSSVSGIATYANTAGISTYATSSGISTVSSGLTGTPNIVVGIVTSSEYYGLFKGSLDPTVIASIPNITIISGIASYSTISGISTSVIGGIVDVSNANISGISTLGFFTDEQFVSQTSSLAENTTYYSIHKNITVGSGATLTIGTGSSIILDRFNNLDDVKVDSLISVGVITALSFYGDGSNLSNIISGVGIASGGTIVGTGVTILDFSGSGISTITVSSGIATISVENGTTEINKQSFTVGIGGTNTFILNKSYDSGYVDVYINGVRLSNSSFIETNPTTITLTESANSGDIVEFQSFKQLDGLFSLWRSSVYGKTYTNNSVGIKTTNPTSALYVVGDAYLTGIVTAFDFNSASDSSLKDNVHTIENALDTVSQIRGVTFDWKNTKKPSIGVIAQEVEQVLPELVSDTDPKAVNYNGLIGILIEAIKELKQEVEDLKKDKN